jgi:hypothetical protein
LILLHNFYLAALFDKLLPSLKALQHSKGLSLDRSETFKANWRKRCAKLFFYAPLRSGLRQILPLLAWVSL